MENENDEKLKWEDAPQFGSTDAITPILNAMLMLIEVEQQKTLEQVEQVKKMLETMKNTR